MIFSKDGCCLTCFEKYNSKIGCEDCINYKKNGKNIFGVEMKKEIKSALIAFLIMLLLGFLGYIIIISL